MDLCSLGAATVVNSSGQYGIARASCQRIVQDDATDAKHAEDQGEMPIACALGVTALPAPPSADGTCAEGVTEFDVGGFPAVVVAGWDARCTDVAGQLSSGDTCLHGTHTTASKRARVFCKENLLALLIGDDTAIVVDRGGENLKINLFGQSFEMSATNGILMTGDGGAYIQIKGGTINMVGNVAFGNQNPATKGAVAVMTSAGVPAASLSVFTNG